jgi:hypothetical protein
MVETNRIVERGNKEVHAGEHWQIERAREVLKATGRLHEFEVSDIAAADLRELVEIVQHSRRMREAGLSITREGRTCSAAAGGGLIWDEVMKW